MQLVPTTTEHIKTFIPQDYQKEAWEEAKEHLLDYVLDNTRTIVIEEVPVAILGAVHKWSNHWVGYTIYGAKVLDNPYIFARPFRGAIEDLFEEYKMTRLEITTPCDNPKASRLAEFLGFALEGRARKYGRDEGDHYIFAKIRE